MQALVIDGGLAYQPDWPTPAPAAGEALVRVTLAGICGTDLALVRGYHAFRGVPGHEFVGVVDQAPRADWVSRRVVAAINVGCGECPECRRQGPEHCATRRVLGILGRDGAFAELVAVPVANLLPVPAALSDEQAVFAEPLAAALQIRQQGLLAPGDRVAVLGAGKLGLLAAQVAALDGAEVTVLARRPAGLGLARRLGLTAALADECAGGCDVVIEATGDPAGLDRALELVRPRGTVVLKSTFHGRASVDVSRAVVNEVRLVGSRCGLLAPALRLLASGAVRTQELIAATYPLADGLAAFARAAEPGGLKVLLRP
jgi:threonine dehydrogenase-like Zn-dependent dehydrogenase